MNWNDYEAVWKRQELPVGANADLPTLRATFETKHRRQAKTLFLRDVAESSAGVLVAGVLTLVWWRLGRDGWSLILAIGLILAVTVRFLWERVRTHRGRLGADAPLKAKIEADITELRHQRQLLLGLWWWYLVPCAGAILIAVAAAVRVANLRSPGIFGVLWDHPAALAWIGVYFVVILPVCFWGAWVVNRRAVSKQIDPRLAELEKLHRDLTGAGN